MFNVNNHFFTNSNVLAYICTVMKKEHFFITFDGGVKRSPKQQKRNARLNN